MLDIVFVILHYNTLQTTCECINSIETNLDSENYKIVVVDNCSPNNSYLDLKKYYKNNNNIIIIQTFRNLGFAKGNNFGIDYALKMFKFKYLCCCNNDIILYQKDFLLKLNQQQVDNKVAVIAPKVYKKDGTLQTYDYSIRDKKYYEKMLRKLIFYKKHKTLLLIKNQIGTIYKNIRSKEKTTDFFYKNHYNILLHGCCLIFTKTFFENYSGFNPKTFLYKEEELLYIMIKKKNLKTFYDADVYITHLEDVATNSVSMTSKNKIDFVYKNQIDSLKILIEEMKNK